MLVLNEKNAADAKEMLKNGTVVTLGKFDGIHHGHAKIIEKAKEYASKLSLKTLMLSFYPHPAAYFSKCDAYYTILSREERVKEAEKYGIDIFAEYVFSDELAAMQPEGFVRMLADEFNCKVIVVGYDYHFGKDRKGDFALLKKLGEKYNFKAVQVGKVEKLGERVSSTNIRKCIAKRDLKMAEILLGKKYFVSGKVCEGNRIGRTIGFPTANILPSADKLLPPDGVYITTCEIAGQKYKSITNIGKNPTVNGREKTVETYIFDFDKDIYGFDIKVDFCCFLRGEVKFDGLDALKKRLEADKTAAEDYFQNNTSWR